MFNLILAVCSAVGGSFDGGVPTEWVAAYRASLEVARARENDWMEYYKTARPSTWINNGTSSRIQWGAPYIQPTMQWAVPNQMLPGAPQLPIPLFPPYGAYPDFPPPR